MTATAHPGSGPGLRRTVQSAVMLATVLIGILYIFTTYAADVAFGPAKFHTFNGDSWESMARTRYGFFWFFVFLAIVNSTIANANAGVNLSSRTAFAMGRTGAFPRLLALVSPRHRSPVAAVGLAHLDAEPSAEPEAPARETAT